MRLVHRANPRLVHRLRQGRGNGFPHGWCHRGAVDRFGDYRRPRFGAILPASPGLSTASGVLLLRRPIRLRRRLIVRCRRSRMSRTVRRSTISRAVHCRQRPWGRRPTSRNTLHAIAAAVRPIPNPLHLRRARRTKPTPRTATRRCKLRRVTSLRLPVHVRITELPALRLNRARTNRMQRARRCRSIPASSAPASPILVPPGRCKAIRATQRYRPRCVPRPDRRRRCRRGCVAPWSITTPRSQAVRSSRHGEHLSVSRARPGQGAALRHRRRARGLHLGRRRKSVANGGIAGLASAGRDDRPPALSAALHGGRPGQPARRARALSRQDALSHPRHQSAVDHRHVRVVGMHSAHQRDITDLYTHVQVGTAWWCCPAGRPPRRRRQALRPRRCRPAARPSSPRRLLRRRRRWHAETFASRTSLDLIPSGARLWRAPKSASSGPCAAKESASARYRRTKFHNQNSIRGFTRSRAA